MYESIASKFNSLSPWLRNLIAGFLLGDVLLVAGLVTGVWDVSITIIALVTATQLSLILGIVAVTGAKKAIRKWGELIEDDIEDLLSGRITKAQMALASLFTMTVWFLYQAYVYDEWSVRGWWSVPVWVYFAGIGAFVFWWIGHTEWYNDRHFEIKYILYGIMVAGVILCIWTGTGAVNRDRNAVMTGQAPGSTYYLKNSPHAQQIFYVLARSSESMPSCSGKSCEGLGVIYGILLVVVLATASSSIPHFWVLACIILIMIVARFTIKEFKARKSEVYVDIDIPI